MEFLSNYGYIGIFIVIAILFTALMVFLPFILRYTSVVPRKPDPVKTSTYECGLQTIGKTWVQFNFRYYVYALVFIVLDVTTAFLYPWAVGFKEGIAGEPQLFLIGAMLVFIVIMVVGYIFVWRKKLLEWK